VSQTLSALNSSDRAAFVAALGHLFEHSPWVADETFPLRPFADADSLHAALCATMFGAPAERQLALVRAHPDLAGRLAQAGEADLFSVGYRLAPEYFFPAPVRDGIDAYRALLAQGADPRQIVLAGDGSGGGLAFAVALAIRNAGLAMPAAIAAMSPWADLSLSGWSLLTNQKSDNWLNWSLLFQCARHYLRKANPADAYASPVFANLKDFPPVMVHAGSAEILRDDSSKLGDRAAEAQTPMSVEIYDGMGHLFQTERESNEAKVSLSRLGQFIRNKTRIEEAALPEPETSESDAG